MLDKIYQEPYRIISTTLPKGAISSMAIMRAATKINIKAFMFLIIANTIKKS